MGRVPLPSSCTLCGGAGPRRRQLPAGLASAVALSGKPCDLGTEVPLVRQYRSTIAKPSW